MGFFRRSRNQTKNSGIAILSDSNRMRTFLSRTIFNIPEIRTAIEKISETFATIPVWRKRIDNNTGEVEYINDRLDYILNFSPNPYQNKSQFWNFNINKALLNNSMAIQIIYDDTGTRYLYPLPFHKSRPQDDLKTLVFADDPIQKKYDVQDIILITRFSEFGRGTENHATDLYEHIISAIQSRALANTEDGKRVVAAVKKSLTQMGSKVKPGDSVTNVNDIADQVKVSKLEGFAYLDGATDIIPLNIPEIRVEKELLAIIIEATYNYFGISEKIIKGTALELEYEQFIMGIIKFFAKQCEEEFTRKIFTEREVQVGNRIEFDYMALQISTLAGKVAKINSGILNGWMNQDESREDFGMSPIPGGLGKKYRGNLNSANLEVIDEYQLKKANGNGGFTNAEK